jgi:predicted nucleic acid-binding protein
MVERVFFDTSVLVVAMVAAHPFHERAKPHLIRAHERSIEPLVACHSLAELYAVLTKLPLKPRVSPSIAFQLIEHNIKRSFSSVALSAAEYFEILEDMSQRRLRGGIIYDALIAKAASKVNPDQLLTFNLRHFETVWRGDPAILRSV